MPSSLAIFLSGPFSGSVVNTMRSRQPSSPSDLISRSAGNGTLGGGPGVWGGKIAVRKGIGRGGPCSAAACQQTQADGGDQDQGDDMLHFYFILSGKASPCPQAVQLSVYSKG